MRRRREQGKERGVRKAAPACRFSAGPPVCRGRACGGVTTPQTSMNSSPGASLQLSHRSTHYMCALLEPIGCPPRQPLSIALANVPRDCERRAFGTAARLGFLLLMQRQRQQQQR